MKGYIIITKTISIRYCKNPSIGVFPNNGIITLIINSNPINPHINLNTFVSSVPSVVNLKYLRSIGQLKKIPTANPAYLNVSNVNFAGSTSNFPAAS